MSEMTMAESQVAEPADTILDRIRAFIMDYMLLPSEAFADMLALYVVHTHAIKAARTTPYIYITSQGPGSGKTRLLEVMEEVCNAPYMFAGMTGPVMFRMIEARKPTIFLDEVDSIYSGAKNEELRGVLNSGYKHNGSIPRVDASAEDGVRDFSTFCPKVLAGIDNGQVPDTVIDRSITVRLKKARPGTVKPFYAEDVEELAKELKLEIQAWVAAHMDELKDRANRPEAMSELNDRQNDIARPLLTIADRVPGWGERARIAFAAIFGEQETPLSPPVEALTKVRDYFAVHPNELKITSAKVAELTGYSGKKNAVFFKGLGIPTAGTYSINGEVAKGYNKADFANAFERYCPPLPEEVA